jgi:hypothetical protein
MDIGKVTPGGIGVARLIACARQIHRIAGGKIMKSRGHRRNAIRHGKMSRNIFVSNDDRHGVFLLLATYKF